MTENKDSTGRQISGALTGPTLIDTDTIPATQGLNYITSKTERRNNKIAATVGRLGLRDPETSVTEAEQQKIRDLIERGKTARDAALIIESLRNKPRSEEPTEPTPSGSILDTTKEFPQQRAQHPHRGRHRK